MAQVKDLDRRDDDSDQQDWEFEMLAAGNKYQVSIRRTGVTIRLPELDTAVPLDRNAAETVYVLDRDNNPDHHDWEFETLGDRWIRGSVRVVRHGNKYQVSIRRTGIN
jgi:hypothetical protein